MAIDRLGRRQLPPCSTPDCADEPEFGIPGSEKATLFYQQRHVLPVVSHGEGIYIFDVEGRRYIDGCSGAVSANLGHAHPRMVRAGVQQLQKIAFAYRAQFENQPANDLADLLVRLSPPGLERVFFVNSGSEAVESAIKLARQYWWVNGKQGKSLVISRRPSYHGATLGALAVTGYSGLTAPFQAMSVHHPKVSAPFCYHCPLGKSYPECGVDCAHELERTIRIYGPENVAAFLTESIGGASTGAAVPPDEYFGIVEKICHDYGVLLIVDDVMVGCGRTGTFYGYEHWDITPDIVAASKGLSGGYAPIGAIIANSAIVDPVLESGGFLHGHTYAGNPLSCAIALEAVHTVLDEGLVENSREVGTYLHQRLREVAERYPVVGDVRGRGLFAAIEFVSDRANRTPFPDNWFVAWEATEIAKDKGLLVYPRRSIFGLSGDHVLIAPPLVIDRGGVDELIEVLDATLSRLTALLEDHLAEEERKLAEVTVERYHQVEEVADYARGVIDDVEAVEAANVTHAMDQGQMPLLESEEVPVVDLDDAHPGGQDRYEQDQKDGES